MTINELVAEVTEINTANGWREPDHMPLDEGHPVAQIAGLTVVAEQVAETVEAIRTRDPKVDYLYDQIRSPLCWKEDATEVFLGTVSEYGVPVYGSKTEAICRLRLIDTETAEASEAVIKGDVANLAEELADITIRVLDFVGAWNDAHPDQPIDLEAAIRAKLDRNRARGWRHGGKLA
ncbi:MazG nucleotide pyrophosphohydrolase domain-containing protein [Symbiobacterium terraclitae]|uniref:MazG nucleotide pyrophosphohydrolase domain-containing protein n=1 Tax=Symbiobacterium terraclitae TaxID=557451 RepID=UPI0035B50638